MKISKQYLINLIKEEISQSNGEEESGNVSYIDQDGYEGAMAKSNLFNIVKDAKELYVKEE